MSGKLEAQCISPFWAIQSARQLWNALEHPAAQEEAKQFDPGPHIPPFVDCSCGIYALNSGLDEEEVTPWQADCIVGITFVWGHILEGSRGFRGQYAKIAALQAGTPDVEEIASVYDVPLVYDLNSELEKQKERQGGS